MDRAIKPNTGGWRMLWDDRRAFFGMFRIRLIGSMQYRAAAWAGIVTQFFFGFLRLSVLVAFSEGTPGQATMSYPQMASYIWLQQGLLALVAMWYEDSELLIGIRDGTIGYELCRPVGLYGFWFARLLGTRLARAALRIFPLSALAMLLPAPFRLLLPPSWSAAGLFVLSLSLSSLLVVAFSMFIYILALATLSMNGTTIFFTGLSDFLSGLLIPIPLMPAAMQRVVQWLPFRYIADFPLRLYSGHVAGIEAAQGFAVQIAWLVVLTVLGAWALGRMQRRLVVQGG